jgi:hypothetical protein
MLELIKSAPTWSTLKKAESNKIVQSMHIWLIIVPILAKIMSTFEGPLKICISETMYVFDISLPFTWVVFFISALFFTFANLTFIIFSPDIIKDNQDFSDFDRSGKDEGHLEIYLSTSMRQKWRRELLKLAPHKLKVDIKEWFWKAYKDQDSSLVTARRFCLAFYSIGFLSILGVGLENIWWVLQQINF